MTGPYSMLGFDDARRPFVKEDVDTDDAKAEAIAKDLVGFLLLPHYAPYQYRAYKRVGPGEYEQFHTRIFLFRHILNRENTWIPSREERSTRGKTARRPATTVREDIPRCYVLTPEEVSKLANRDKHGENHWLEPPQYDTEEFAERWDRIGSGLT